MKNKEIMKEKIPRSITRKSPLIKVGFTVKKFFYVFLDISGVLLGIFLIWLGVQMMNGISPSKVLGIVVMILGICAFLIHLGHYYNWKLRQWIFGSEDYFITRRK